MDRRTMTRHEQDDEGLITALRDVHPPFPDVVRDRIRTHLASATVAAPLRTTKVPHRLRALTVSLALVAVVFVLGSTGMYGKALSAVRSLISLGPPATSVPSYSPALGDWRRTGPNLRRGGKPVVLFVGTKFEESAPERWPIVKALQQFGTFQGLKPDTHAACGPVGVSGIPTFDWTNARYQSAYVVFDHREIPGLHGELLQRLSPQETKLFRKEVGTLPASGCTAVVRLDVHLPLVSVGGYLLRGADSSLDQDQFYDTSGTGSQQAALSFNSVQAALNTVKPNPSNPATYAAIGINNESNIITALICHADRKRPERVCGRPVIRQLLRHVR